VTIYDRIFDLEGKLDKPDLDFLSRRLTLRRMLEEVRAEGFSEGHREGMRDARDAESAEREKAEAAAVVPLEDGQG
jgi:hypothetical protein